MRKMIESGVAWVGKMPDGWTIRKGKHTLIELNRPVEETDDVITCFRDGEVTLRKNRREDGFTVSLKEIGYQGIEPNDLVIHGMDGFAGSIGISDSRGKSSPVLVVCDSEQNKRYLMYYLRSMAYNDVFTALATGIRVRSCDLRWNKIAELPFILPNIDEQKEIVNKIEKTSDAIDALIANEQAQIEKLKQYKQSLITEVVTKGLDPNAPMKDSGVEWIKKIPREWTIAPLKVQGSFSKGLPITKADLRETGIFVINYGQIHAKSNTGVKLDENLLRKVSVDYLASHTDCLINYGDIVFADTSEDYDGLGNAVLMDRDDDVFAGYHTIIMRMNDSKLSKYYAYLFQTDNWRFQLRVNASGIKVFSVTQKMLNNCDVIIPSLEEAHKIVAFLDEKCSSVLRLISIKQIKIDKLTQYKKSLIYEYVTGKKEVCCHDN